MYFCTLMKNIMVETCQCFIVLAFKLNSSSFVPAEQISCGSSLVWQNKNNPRASMLDVI